MKTTSQFPAEAKVTNTRHALSSQSLESLFTDSVIEIDYMSCEMLSDELANAIRQKYPGRTFRISVSEDNENGSEIEYE